jgi:CXXX repeat peptide maturase
MPHLIAANEVIATMDTLTGIWVLLSSHAVRFCNESAGGCRKEDMSLALLREIAERVKKQQWSCDVLAGGDGVTADVLAVCRDMKANLILPAGTRIPEDYRPVTLVFEAEAVHGGELYPRGQHAILRLKRNSIPSLAGTAQTLLESFSRVSFAHPDLALYEGRDLDAYQRELRRIGEFILSAKDGLSRYQIDCLTQGPGWTSPRECGAGTRRLAVGPSGDLYYCPAAEREQTEPLGHILREPDFPNQHLFSRDYSVPCGKCQAWHCVRCVHINKATTHEFCVPSRNMCLLSHYELEVQAWICREAVEHGRWPAGVRTIEPPLVYDPYELVAAEKELPVHQLWRRLVKWNGDPRQLSPAMMLDIMHHLQGWCQALVACARAGTYPSVDILRNDKIASLRRKTIEKYRETILAAGCPTVTELEEAICRLGEHCVRQSSTPVLHDRESLDVMRR